MNKSAYLITTFVVLLIASIACNLPSEDRQPSTQVGLTSAGEGGALEGASAVLVRKVLSSTLDASSPPVTIPLQLAAGYVNVSFSQDLSQRTFVNMVIDLNEDGKWAAYKVNNKTQEEWVVHNIWSRVSADEKSAYHFAFYDLDVDVRTDLMARVVITDEPMDAENWDGTVPENNIEQKDFNISSVVIMEQPYGLNPQTITGTPSNVGLEGGAILEVPTAEGNPLMAFRPHSEYRSVEHSGVPDILQETNECVPTATANNILWLAEENDFTEAMPPTQVWTVGSLCSDMNCSRLSGVPTDGVGPGIDKFINHYNLPIENHVVGTDFDSIFDELKKGQALLLQVGFYDEDGERAGGHAFSVIGAFEFDYGDIGSQHLDVRDPGSAGGDVPISHALELRDGDLLNYNPPFTTKVEAVFAQSPLAPVTATPPVSTEEMSPTEKTATALMQVAEETATALAQEISQSMLFADVDMYCRAGPDKEKYEEEWTLVAGQTVPIVGMYSNGWKLVQIDDPRTRTECCWVGAGVIQGDTTSIPLISSIPPGGSCP